MSVAGRSIGFDQLCAQLEGSLAVVFYGHNHAWMEEEAAALVAAVKRHHPSLSVSRFGADSLIKEPYRLQDALTSPGLFSQGRQLAVIDGGDERSGALVAAFLANPCYSPADGLIVLLAPGQHGSARWLQPLKTQAGVWLRDCYDETPAVRTAFVKRYLQSRDKTATPAALDILQSYLPSDRLMACQDLARLCLLAGANPVIEEPLVTQALTLQLASDVQEFINAYLDGRLPWLAGHAALVDESALPPMVVLRSLQQYLMRLLSVKGAQASGLSQSAAIEQLQPKLFFRHRPGFEDQLRRLSLAQVHQLLSGLLVAEQRVKQTGIPMAEMVNWSLWRPQLAKSLARA